MTFSVGSHRRYCWLKYVATLRDDDEICQSWDVKRRTLPGTDLPASFPARSQLLSAGYLVLEELQGADQLELTRLGLSNAEATAVLAAIGEQ
jgi:hypothetical protein